MPGPMAVRYKSQGNLYTHGNLSTAEAVGIARVLARQIPLDSPPEVFNAVEWVQGDFPVGTRLRIANFTGSEKYGTVTMTTATNGYWPGQGQTAWQVGTDGIHVAVRLDDELRIQFWPVGTLVNLGDRPA
jgi:hypothetical protein